MKPISLLLTVAATTLVGLPALCAGDTRVPGTPPPVAGAPTPPAAAPQPAPEAPGPGVGGRRQLKKQLDRDGNGIISPEERQAAGANARKKVLERFDQDGDGQLSGSERQAAEADREARMLSRFDADGDGKLSVEERQAARQTQPKHAPPATLPSNQAQGARGKGADKPLRLELRPRILQRFDKDGDGKLSDVERTAARDALKARKASKSTP